MQMKFKNKTVKFLGDPHLGKEFKNGVPLSRRGEREATQMQTFKDHLNDVKGVDFHICVGDLFDKFSVAETVVYETAIAYLDAADRNQGTHYIVVMGNHDGSRDSDIKSSFDLFTLALEEVNNISVVSGAAHTFELDRGTDADLNECFAVCPWDPFKTSEEIAKDLGGPLEFVVGHWDIDQFGQDVHNLIPAEKLGELTDTVITGHIHKSETRSFKEEGFDLHVTGSMLPYAHGEDLTSDTYVTYTLAEFEAIQDKSELKDKCVRILLEQGESVSEIPDCLQFSIKRLPPQTEEGEEDDDVKIDEFDLKAVFFKAMNQHDVSKTLSETIWTAYAQTKVAND